MKKLLLFALSASWLLTGCCSCGPKVGWSFQVGRPGTVSTEALVSPHVTSYGLGGLAAVPAAGIMAAASPAHLACLGGAGASAPQLAAVDPCAGITLDELCRRLIALENRLKTARPATLTPPKRMPEGE